MEVKKYQKKTVKEFLIYLNSMGLSVYGPHMVDDVEYRGCMDYSAEDIVFRRKLFDTDAILDGENDDD